MRVLNSGNADRESSPRRPNGVVDTLEPGFRAPRGPGWPSRLSTGRWSSLHRGTGALHRSHAEPRASHGLDCRSRSAHLDLCRALPAEEVEQQLARRSGDAGSRFPPPGSNGLCCSLPLKLETRPAQSPREEPARATDVAPKGLVHCVLVHSRTATVGSAYVLVVDEELVEAREAAHPSDAEEAGWRSGSDRPNELGKVPQRQRSSSSLSEVAPHAGDDKPKAREGGALAEDQVCGEIASRPRLKESRCIGTEFVEQVTDLCSLNDLEGPIDHIFAV
jgi:hypothetical protein